MVKSENPNRQSGRTFRAILKAIVAASEGKEVIFYCRNRVMVESTCSMTKKICESYSKDMIVPSRRDEVCFPNNGVIIFKLKSNFDDSRVVIDDSDI